MIDAVEGLTAQDAHVAGYVVEEGRGLVVAVNKWDLVEDKTDRTFDQYVEWIRNEVPFLDFAPIVSISAKTGQRVGRVLELAVDIWGERRKRIPTAELNRLLRRGLGAPAAAGRQGPPAEDLLRARRPRVAPPTFVFFANDAALDPLQLPALPREPAPATTFGFDGTPIRLVFRDRESVAAAAPRASRGRDAGTCPRARPAGGRRPAVDARADDRRGPRRGRRRGRLGHHARRS